MARYINADSLIDYLRTLDGYELISLKAVLQIIDAEPTADVREVVPCKDCKYITEHYDTDGNAPYWTCSEWDSGTDYDGFCHYAERRSGE